MPDIGIQLVFPVFFFCLFSVSFSSNRLLIHCHDKEYEPQTMQRGDFWVLKNYVRADHGELRCFETVTYTTHADYTFLDNLIPLLERYVKLLFATALSYTLCKSYVRYQKRQTWTGTTKTIKYLRLFSFSI